MVASSVLVLRSMFWGANKRLHMSWRAAAISVSNVFRVTFSVMQLCHPNVHEAMRSV